MIWARLGAIILLLAPVWGQAQSYTLRIETARLLVADAMANRVKDSIIQVNNDEIQRLHDQNTAQLTDLQAIIQLQNEKYVAQEAISQAWMETAAEAQKQVRKEKRGKRLWQWTAGGITAIALFLAVQP